jgi:hypothetical protein
VVWVVCGFALRSRVALEASTTTSNLEWAWPSCAKMTPHDFVEY